MVRRRGWGSRVCEACQHPTPALLEATTSWLALGDCETEGLLARTVAVLMAVT